MLTITFSTVVKRYTQTQNKPFPNIGSTPRAAYSSTKGVTFIAHNSHFTVWLQTQDGAIHELSQHATRNEAMKATRLFHA